MYSVVSKKSFFPDIDIIIIAAYVFFAICGYGRITNIMAAAFMVLYFILIKRIKLKSNIKKSFFYFALFIGYKFIVGLFNMQDPYYYFGTIVMWTIVEFFPLLIAATVLSNKNLYQQKQLLIILGLILFGITIYAISLFAIEEIGGRAYAQSSRGTFLGGSYPIAYSLTLFSVVCCYFIFRSDISKKVKFPLIVLLIISIIHIYLTESVITLLALLFGVAFAFVFRNTSSKKGINRLFFISSCLFILLIVILLNLKNIGLWFIDFGNKVDNQVFSQRIKEIGLYLSKGDDTYHMNARNDTLLNSINTFFQYPIFGASYKVGDTFSLLESIGVGNHSDILDTFARYGIVGGIPFVLGYFYYIKSFIGKKNFSLLVPFSVSIIILMLFNPFTSAQTGFTVFLFIPLLLSVVENEGKYNANNY